MIKIKDKISEEIFDDVKQIRKIKTKESGVKYEIRFEVNYYLASPEDIEIIEGEEEVIDLT